MSHRSQLKNAFLTQQKIYGAWVCISHPAITELFASILRPHFIGIDMEHTTVSLETITHLILAAQSQGCCVLPRVASHDPAPMRRLLDAGADGFIVPNVSTPAELLALVDAIKYPPIGRRGYGVSRAQAYGSAFKEYASQWNHDALLLIIVETLEGVQQIDALVSNEHVDGVLIGRYDLSGALQVPGQLEHPDVLSARSAIIDACRRAHKPWGETLPGVTQKTIAQAWAEGAGFALLPSDVAVLAEWAQQARSLIDGS